MNILIKDNLVYENRSTIDEYDFDLNDINPSKKDLYVGLNGVGKTFMAKRLAYSVIGRKDVNQVQLIQFHQSYSLHFRVRLPTQKNNQIDLRLA